MKSWLAVFCISVFFVSLTLPAAEYSLNLDRKGQTFRLTAEKRMNSLVLSVRGRDSHVQFRQLMLDPADYNAVRIVYKATGFEKGANGGEIFFATTEKPQFNGQSFIALPSVVPDGKWNTMTVGFAAGGKGAANWGKTGTVTALRFDPANDAPGEIEIKEITFFKTDDFFIAPAAHSGRMRISGRPIPGGYFAKVLGYDSNLSYKLPSVNLNKYGRVIISYRATGFEKNNRGGEIYFRSGKENYSDARRINLPPLICDNTLQVMDVDIKSSSPRDGEAWFSAAPIDAIRLDMVNAFPGTIEIYEIRFAPAKEIKYDTGAISWDLRKNPEGWSMVNWLDVKQSESGLTGKLKAGQTAFLITPEFNIRAKDYDTLFLLLRAENSATALIDKLRNGVYGGGNFRQVFFSSPEFRGYFLKLDAPRIWSGNMQRLRFKITAPADGRWTIRQAVLFKADGNLLFSGFNHPAAPAGVPQSWNKISGKCQIGSEFENDISFDGKWYRDIEILYPGMFKLTGDAADGGKVRLEYFSQDGRSIKSENFDASGKFQFTPVAPAETDRVRLMLDGKFKNVAFKEFSVGFFGKKDTLLPHWQAKWIWHKDKINVDFHTVKFTRDFTLPDEKIVFAEMVLCADDSCEVFVNGKPAGKSGANWSVPEKISFGELLKPGKNRIEVFAGQVVSSSGFLAETAVCGENGEILRFGTDRQWLAKFDNTPDEPAFEIGEVPCAPWGDVTYIPIGVLPQLKISGIRHGRFTAGEKAEVSFHVIPGKIHSDKPVVPQVALYNKNGTYLASVNAGSVRIPPEGNRVSTSIEIPSYLPDSEIFVKIDFPGCDVSGEVLKAVTVQGKEKRDFPAVCISVENGQSFISVNGRKIFPDHALFSQNRSLHNKLAAASGMQVIDLSIKFSDVDADSPEFRQDLLNAEKTISGILEANPDFQLLLCLFVSSQKHKKWQEANSGELVRQENGSDVVAGYVGEGVERRESWASARFRQEYGKKVDYLLKHLRSSVFAPRIIGVHFAGGLSSEWFWPGAHSNMLLDYSENGQRDFARYLRHKYGTEAALQQAWKNPSAEFSGNLVPSSKARRTHNYGDFFDPASQKQVIDYNRYQHILDAETIGFFGKKVKEASGGRLIAGAYYGYGINLAESGNGFCQNSGHMALKEYFENEALDFCVVLVNYDFRYLGEPSIGMSSPYSFIVNKKLLWHQADLRTHWQPIHGFGRLADLRQSQSAMRREFIRNITQGSAIQWWDFSFGWTFNDPRLTAEIGIFHKIYEKYRGKTGEFPADQTVLAVFDERAVGRSNISKPMYESFLLTRQLNALTASGLPYKTVMFSDLKKYPELLDYKMIMFLNQFYMTGDDEKFIREKVLDGKHFVTFTGPVGIVSDTAVCPERASGLLKMPLTVSLTPVVPVTVAAGKNGGFPSFGIESERTYSPVLIPAGNSEVEILGTLADGKTPSLAKKGSIVYSLSPCLPPELLRKFAAEAGIHSFSASKDNYFIGNGLCGIHAAYDGKKVIEFPAYCGEITELFSGRKWQKGTRQITVEMKAGDNLLFDCGINSSITE